MADSTDKGLRDAIASIIGAPMITRDEFDALVSRVTSLETVVSEETLKQQDRDSETLGDA